MARSLFVFFLLFAGGCSADEMVPKKWGEGIYVPEKWQVTRGVLGHKVHVLEGKVPCAACHDLSAGEVGQVRLEGCAACHERESKVRHAVARAKEKHGPSSTADCLSCHVFALDSGAQAAGEVPVPEAPAPEDCLRCHDRSQGALAAVEVHRPGDCLACHAPHGQDGPKAAPCAACHEEVTTFHPAERKDPVKRCTTCHERQHAPAEEARGACATCHAESEPNVSGTALFAEGHAECISCHRPHESSALSLVDCRSCHEEMHVLGGQLAAPHRDCKNCHDPHDVKAASATGCANCHAQIHPDHPKHGVAGTCTGCHDPHPTGNNFAKVRPCSTCHVSAANEKAFHGATGCLECHAPHQFRLGEAGQQLCSRCHQENVASVVAHPSHKDCGACHGGLPHHPEKRIASCETCHGTQQALISNAHENCTSCHDAHDRKVAECKTCHSVAHRSAPSGHSKCTSCHEPHSAKANVQSCATCHSDEAKTPHGKLSADCASCHRPHGPKAVNLAPDCASCHKKASLPGLHQVAKHQRCVDCHTPHGELQPQRAACLSCHTQKTEHHPNAPSCASCHLFVPAH